MGYQTVVWKILRRYVSTRLGFEFFKESKAEIFEKYKAVDEEMACNVQSRYLQENWISRGY